MLFQTVSDGAAVKVLDLLLSHEGAQLECCTYFSAENNSAV